VSGQNVVAELADRRTLARLLRAALANDVAHVPLASPPLAGRFTLQLRVAGRPGISVAAEVTAGTALPQGYPMRLSPLDPSHIAELTALLDEPVVSSATSGPATEMEPAAMVIDPDDLDESVLFDPDAALASRPSARPRGTGKEDTLTVPHRPSMAPDWKKTDPDLADKRPPPSGTPTSPFPLRRRIDRTLDETPVSEDTGTMRSSQRGPRTMQRQHAILGVGSTVANKYRIEEHIGSGAVGAVYRASHAELGRDVALKVLHPHYQSDAHLLASFRAEARAASLLQHPNVTVVHDFGTDVDGTVYIVMELLSGSTLQMILDDQRRLDAVRAIKLMLQVCAALAAAHERGIVHRDVKPDNIIIASARDDDGEPYEHAKVCDFGIAALTGPGTTLQGALDADVTAGTPEYMAPEQALGHTDPRTDVYACAVVLYEMLSGRPPFVGESAREVLAKHMTEIARPLGEIGIAAKLDEIVRRGLEKDPDRRFNSMRELRSALKRLL